MSAVKLNKSEIKDKVYACWIGKNIGGTIGGPYENAHDFLDIKGFSTEPGDPLPNDDLDLQLMWLIALEKEGPFNFDSRTLAEYWALGIDPNWNEYGTGKANLFDGIMPPLSGELNNDYWKNSNGAWIRSEIWACLTPGYPQIARQYAYADAVVDHGLNEGTYAELFTTTMQSLAFFNNDIEEIIKESLKVIPQDSRLAKSINFVIEEFHKGTPYRQVRDMLIELNSDMGWFQAPSNVGFVIIGLLYGEKDFKKSLIYTVNCADDADCTAGTVGATLGILLGTKGIPEDWVTYIGDDIKTICINAHYRRIVPKTCQELTERVISMIPFVLKSKGLELEWTDGENEFQPLKKFRDFTANISKRSKWTFDLPHVPHAYAYGEYSSKPQLKEGEQIKISLKVTNLGVRSSNFKVTVLLPDGWSADYEKSFHIATFGDLASNKWEATITAGKTESINHVVVICDASVQAQPIIADFVIKG
ncbi:MAG: ADP-ribosylglycohydrolase family protein [Clostridia bacterium]|nr:ADP-ribosylglycohydrolase family protein [Clostridia bacterium]